MNDSVFEAFKQLSQKEQKTLLDTLLSRLQLSGGFSSFENQFSDGYGYGGRIGYTQPIGEDSLTFGLRGSGYKVNTPFGSFSDSQLTGGDVGYQFGPNRVSASYERQAMLGNELGQVPVNDLIKLIYSRQF